MKSPLVLIFFFILVTPGFSSPIPSGFRAPFDPPALDDIPKGPVGDAIRYGQELVSHTAKALPAHVGNELNCTSCHLDGGRVSNAIPWVGIWGVFPEYRARNGRVNSLPDRVNDCFERSLNGKPLGPDTKEMAAILSYMWWLSRGVPTGAPVDGRGFGRITAQNPPDPQHGKLLYGEKCALCHGLNGAGRRDSDGGYLFPPLWGKGSFNIGAGMARLESAAAFIKWNMPRGQGNSLSDQDAYDIASYFTRQTRPDFRKKHLDWPNGGKPKDARY